MSIRTRFGTVLCFALLAAGCARDPAPGSSTSREGGWASDARGSGASAQSEVPPARRIFATLPDRGELLAYSRQPPTRDGAYTWHRTELSEVHALRAIANGHLRVSTPAGQVLDIAYDRHVEHPSGDWTWIGHAPGHPEQQTILTFGARAAFGSIAQPDGPPLRLTVRDGASWLVETDAMKVGGIDNAATRPRHPDFVIAPKLTTAAPAFEGMRPVAATATATDSGSTVDLVLGFTAGFASANNGSSGAVTRLNNLVDVANAAYVNSQVSARVRLVATVQVAFPDATSNDSALAKLTGYDSSSNTHTTPDPAFNALRAAREKYGADLVSLVRDFNEPENDGCGIAWLIGGGQSGVSTSDSSFGYSVVSDGRDAGTDGKTYFCVDETLAHELGHNMGAAHDIETSKGDDGVLDSDEYGAYSYSFGYKNSTPVPSDPNPNSNHGGSKGFFTLMAYGDSGQRIFRTFSTPRTKFCAGFACGTAAADNARTLTQTIPIIATFRATVVAPEPPASTRLLLNDLDANGDGRSDLLLRTHSGARFVAWFMSGTTRTGYQGVALANAYHLAATGDFNGDHRTDLVWTSSARDILISMSVPLGYRNVLTPYSYDASTQLLGAADINGNGRADILLRDQTAGKLYVWYMDGTNRIGYNAHSIAPAYQFVGVGDLNHDGRQDPVWTNAQRGILVSLSLGASFNSVVTGLSYSSDYELAGVTDVNGDRNADLLFRSAALGKVVVWFMNGSTRLNYIAANAAGSYTLVGKGDFNGDRRGDLLWRGPAGQISMLISTGSGFSSQSVPYTYASDYHLMDVD